MVELSLEQAFLQAEYHVENGEVSEARKFYKAILSSVPNNEKAQTALTALHKVQVSTDIQSPPQEIINQLLNLYNSGNLEAVAKQASLLTEQYPEAFVVWNILGAANKGLGDFDKALLAFKKITELNPRLAEPFNNMGVALKEQGKLGEAIEAYNNALFLKPDYSDALSNLGNVYKILGKIDEAIASYNKALSLQPDYAEAYNNIGNALKDQGELEEAIEAYTKALSLKPDYVQARSHRLYLHAQICDWGNIAEDVNLIPRLGTIGKSIPPFSVLALEDAPERHRLRSANFAKDKFPKKPLKQFERPTQMPKRLRIGYFSADFHDHATMYLMAQVFAAHDKAQYEIFAYSYGPNSHSAIRNKLINEVDVFHDISQLNDMHIIELVLREKLDVAIDLKGYTKDSKTALFSSRLAPVQINYLGYPGTLGADFIDYIVADPIVIPENKRQHYSEQIMYLPHTYQPNDNTRTISQKIQTREDMGLPNDAFVFCCFNNNYKISPKEFDIWMRLMAKVEGSVLWLLKSNQWAEHNLKREAEARGISKDRVIFAERLENSEHLARHRLADLFVDTFNVNAHTTASDALWAGLPVVTKLGKGFAARVAGSLLNAVGLPELITDNEEAYEALILELATKPKKLKKIKEKLETNRLSTPLFDTEQYTKHLENGYLQAYHKFFNEEIPNTIIVPE